MWAVRNLSFEVSAGQTLGVIGPNGAGKTTVLKLLSRITTPTEGCLTVNGRVAALIELGAGFHPELTGRENIFLNGTILGMRRAEIKERFEDIVEFSGLVGFVDTPVKYYSSGMYARLGFAVAAHTNPDILLVDEVLAVGDYAFQQRCYLRMRELQERGTTVVLVSHNLSVISDVCELVIVLDRGKVAFRGPVSEGIGEYAERIRKPIRSKDEIKAGEDGIGQRLMTHEAKVEDVRIVDDSGEPVKVSKPGDWITVQATVEFHQDAPYPHFACFVRNESGLLIYDQTTLWQSCPTRLFSKGERTTIRYQLQMNVVEGVYTIGVDLHYQDLTCFYDRIESAASLVVRGQDGAKGVADLRCRFLIDRGLGDAAGQDPRRECRPAVSG